MSLLLLLSTCCLGLAASRTAPPYALEDAALYFQKFKEDFNRQYVSEHEQTARFQIFKDNLEKVNQMNQKSENAVFGITKFMDLTPEEAESSLSCLKTSPELTFPGYCANFNDEDIPDANAPESFDWREHNAVSTVKDQGGCGTCYAFSSLGTAEGQHAIKHGEIIDLSVQQIMDCDGWTLGCGGGNMDQALRFLADQGGSMAEVDYPYTAVPDCCKFDGRKVKVNVIGCNSYNLTSQEKLKQVIYSYGPVAAAVRGAPLMFYSGGVLRSKDCARGPINHGVLIVGYGIENGTLPYWIIKNSWGEIFGEKGYYRLERGEGQDSCHAMNRDMTAAVVE